jgi:hypothetical protein
MHTQIGLSFVLLGSIAAGTGCTNSVRRAALVPHQQAITHSGARAQSTQISLGTTNLLSSRDPRLAEDENAGIVIPRWQGQGGVRMPWGANTTIGVHGEYGLNNGGIALSDDQPDPKGDVMGGAVSLFYTAKASPKLDIGFGGQFWVYSIPYAEYETCINCPGTSFTNVEHDRDLISVVSLGIIPTYTVGPGISIFGGVNARNHPTIEKSSITIGGDFDDDEEVEAGPLNFIVSLGADVLVTERIKLTGYIQKPVESRPADYGLTAGFMVSLLLPATKPQMAQPPTQTQPPMQPQYTP